MDISEAYKVGVRRKIPYVTNLFLELAMIFFIVILLFDLLFYPIRSFSAEMKAAIFYFLIPEVWKKILIISVIGFVISAWLYSYLRYYKSAILKFNLDEIIIRGRLIKLRIPIKTISRIYCNDASDLQGMPKEKLSITIEQSRLKATTLKLKHYDQAENFIDNMMRIHPDLKVYNFSSMPTHMEEE